MDAAIMEGMRKIVHKGEQIAPIKKVKQTIKFDTKAVEDKKKEMSKRIKKSHKK